MICPQMERGWQYGERWNDDVKTHPRLKPYNLLTDYVGYLESCKTNIEQPKMFLGSKFTSCIFAMWGKQMRTK